MEFANNRRGLKIAGSDFSYLTEGAVGLIFVNATGTRVRKLYRRPDHQNLDHCHRVFDTEIEAYDIANRSATVRPYVAEFFGVTGPHAVIDGEGCDVSSEFLDGLAFEAEFIPGYFDKLSRSLTPEDRDKLALLFKSEGIMDIQDASGLYLDDGNIKIVDFSTRTLSLSW